jgi:hypothetical protein
VLNYVLDTISNKDSSSKLSIVFRHPKREEITDAAKSFNTPLVSEGREIAIELGKKLSPKFSYNIYHSKYPRCVETAELILRGIEETKHNTESKISGSKEFLSDSYISDTEFLIAITNETGGEEVFISEWYQNKLDPNKIMPFQTSSNLFIQKLLETINEENKSEIEIFITHDWELILIMNKIMDITSSDFFWPAYFEPIILEQTANEIRICIREYCKRFDLSYF